MMHELLEVWRETRSQEVAALIEELAAAHPRPPITGGSQRALHAAWLEVDRADDPLDVDRLLGALVIGNLTQAGVRLRSLARRPPDPRIATGLEAVLASPPSASFVKGTAIELWDELFRILERIADPRTLGLPERLPWLAHERATSPFDVGKLRSRTVTAVHRMLAAIPPADPPTADQRARIAALTARVRATPRRADRGRELLERIYDRPHDLDTRSVYGDWLTANGDPRGELIALQLARPLPTTRPWQHYRARQSSREKVLLRTHEKVWVGRLGTLLDHVRFERGFPAWGHLANEIDVASLAIPEAATLDHLSVRRDDFATGRRLASRPFHGLTSASAIGWQTLAGLVDQPGATVRAVEVSFGELPGDVHFLDRDAQLELFDLDIGHMSSPPPPPERVQQFMRAPVIARVRTLCVGANVGNEVAFVEGFLASSIERLEFGGYGHALSLHLERGPAGLRIVLHGDRLVLAKRREAFLEQVRQIAGGAVEVVEAS